MTEGQHHCPNCDPRDAQIYQRTVQHERVETDDNGEATQFRVEHMEVREIGCDNCGRRRELTDHKTTTSESSPD